MRDWLARRRRRRSDEVVHIGSHSRSPTWSGPSALASQRRSESRRATAASGRTDGDGSARSSEGSSGGSSGSALPPELFRSEWHRFVCNLVVSSGFNRLTIGVIVLNTISIGAETFRALKITGNFNMVFGALDLVFVTYYTVELALKIFSYPRSFWFSKYNQFDVFVLATSYIQLAQDILGAALLPLGNVTFLRVLRALRALRALRGISFIRSLQVLVAVRAPVSYTHLTLPTKA